MEINGNCTTEITGVSHVILKLPDNEYVHFEENGKHITVCTMRQKALHTIGLNSGHVGRRLYTRHGKRYYKPFRNYFSGNDGDLDKLVEHGYMDMESSKVQGKTDYRTYWFNRKGLDWMGEQLGIHIYNPEG